MLDDERVRRCNGNFSDDELSYALEQGERQYPGMDFELVSGWVDGWFRGVWPVSHLCIGYETSSNGDCPAATDSSNGKENQSERVALVKLEIEE